MICARARCGRTFEPTRWNQRFCKPSCSNVERVARCKKRNAGRLPLIGHIDTCEHCKGSFIAVSPSQVGGERQRYCKDECKSAARSVGRKARRILGQ